ncbi:unnamed protein product [Timema podura]|uniref:DNA helicase n=1 Tax=Timema podura TaxID=61482 RepID=A0ABN7NJ20_TIMPD|nr:unnamed protein product [Timema podura]
MEKSLTIFKTTPIKHKTKYNSTRIHTCSEQCGRRRNVETLDAHSGRQQSPRRNSDHITNFGDQSGRRRETRRGNPTWCRPVSWYSSFAGMFKEYALVHHKDELISILSKEEEMQHYSIQVNFVTLYENSTELGDCILSNPNDVLLLCDTALVQAQGALVENQPEDTQHLLAVKTNIHARMTGLPTCPELHRTIFPHNDDMGCFLQVSGTVVRIVVPKMLEFQRDYICAKCKHSFKVQADYEQFYLLPNPTCCPNPQEQCQGTNFKPVKTIDQFNCKDFQEIKIQEQVTKLKVGTIPRSMWVTLEDDLVDTCKPGDDIVIW